MVFTILFAADVGGKKHNYAVPFATKPDINKLKYEAGAMYSSKGMSIGPLTSLVIQDAKKSWQPLTSGTQLFDYCQVFAKKAPSTGGGERDNTTATVPQQSVQRQTRNPSPVPQNDQLVVARQPQQQQHQQQHQPVVLSSGSPTAPTRQVPFTERVETVFSNMQPPQTANSNSAVTGRDIRRHEWNTEFDLLPEISHEVDNLFNKSDTNRDGLIDFSEFQRFCEMYPTVLDSLYYRGRDRDLDRAQKAAIREQEQALARADDDYQKVMASLRDTQSTAAGLDADLKRQGDVLSDSIKQQQGAQQNLENAQNATQLARNELQDAILRVEQLHHEEGQRIAKSAELENQLAGCEAVTGSERQKLDKELAVMADIERMLADQQRVVRTHEQLVKKAAADEQLVRDNLNVAMEGIEAAKRDWDTARSVVADREGNVAAHVDGERGAEQLLRDCVNRVAREQAKRDLIEREILANNEREAAQRGQETDAANDRSDAQRRLAAMRAENLNLQNRRTEAEREEQEMIQQEVDLRAKRESLEHFEANLRNNHQRFAVRYAGRGEPTGSTFQVR